MVGDPGQYLLPYVPHEVETGQVIIYILTLVAVSILISVIPAITVVSGWYTGKKVSALLIGVILLPVLYALAFIVVLHDTMVFTRVPETIMYLAGLPLVSGLAGYCAAQKTNRCLSVAIALAGLWVFIAMSGFN